MSDQESGTLCAEAIQAQAYLDHVPFRVMLYFQAVTNVFCLATNTFFLTHICHKIFLPPNCKFLIIAQIGANMVHGFFTMALSVAHLYLFYSAGQSGCNIIVTRRFCILFKIPVDSAMASIVTLTVAVVAERFFATWRLRSYEKSKVPYGLILGFVALLTSCSWCSWIDLRLDLSTRVAYCSTNSAGMMLPLLYMVSTMVTLEFLAVIGLFILRRINLQWRQKLKFEVSLRYQVDENLDVLDIIRPWILSHLTFVVIFYVTIIVPPNAMDWRNDEMALRTFIGYAYLFPIAFSTLSPLLMWLVFVWLRRKKKDRLTKLETRASADQYYSAYKNLW